MEEERTFLAQGKEGAKRERCMEQVLGSRHSLKALVVTPYVTPLGPKCYHQVLGLPLGSTGTGGVRAEQRNAFCQQRYLPSRPTLCPRHHPKASRGCWGERAGGVMDVG